MTNKEKFIQNAIKHVQIHKQGIRNRETERTFTPEAKAPSRTAFADDTSPLSESVLSIV